MVLEVEGLSPLLCALATLQSFPRSGCRAAVWSAGAGMIIEQSHVLAAWSSLSARTDGARASHRAVQYYHPAHVVGARDIGDELDRPLGRHCMIIPRYVRRAGSRMGPYKSPTGSGTHGKCAQDCSASSVCWEASSRVHSSRRTSLLLKIRNMSVCLHTARSRPAYDPASPREPGIQRLVG